MKDTIRVRRRPRRYCRRRIAIGTRRYKHDLSRGKIFLARRRCQRSLLLPADDRRGLESTGGGELDGVFVMTSALRRRRPLAVRDEAGRRNGRCPDRASNSKSSLGSCVLPFLLDRMTISENGSIDLQGARLNSPARSLNSPINNVQSGIFRFPENKVKYEGAKRGESRRLALLLSKRGLFYAKQQQVPLSNF